MLVGCELVHLVIEFAYQAQHFLALGVCAGLLLVPA